MANIPGIHQPVTTRRRTEIIEQVRRAMPAVGAFTLAAAPATTTTVSDANVTADCTIVFTPTNAAAGALWLSAKTEADGFTVTHAAGGMRTYDYAILFP